MEIVEHVGPDGEVSRLPAGERVLWSGQPDQGSLARYLLRERWFLALVVFSFSIGAAEAMQQPEGAVPRLVGVATLSAIMALVAIVSIRVLAWQISRSSKYVITDKRVYFNIGIVMRADANIPYSSVEGVDLRRRSNGSADLMVTLSDEQEIPWLLLFPHMTWRGRARGRPTFRSLRTPQVAADALVGALRDYAQPDGAAVAGASAAAVPSNPRASRTSATPTPA
ncbi:MAG: PH domain-containing protein [Gemmatimonadaceae bacterium]|nr:PH domain-containing protein [Gemmatimonadaceae bacterium]